MAANSTAKQPKHRISFAKLREPLQAPNLLGLQVESFDWLLGNDAWKARVDAAQASGRNNVPDVSGLEEIFHEISPIEDVAGTMSLSFHDHRLESPKYSMEEAKAKAEAVLAAYAEGRSFEESAGDGTYTHLAHADRSVTSDMLTWAFAADRAEGDTTVAEQSSGYVAVLFHSRSRDDYHPVTVRHILVEDEATAEEILADFKAGDATESDFATLAATKSTDSGTASNGGLVSNMRKGAYVQPFEDWSFDPSRQSGDTGIVESDYGFHVMYFVETNELPYWEYKATNTLKSSAVNDWYDAITDGVTAEQLDAIEYVG